MNLFRITGKSLVDLFHPRILVLVLVPMLASLMIWAFVGYFLWGFLEPLIAQNISQLETQFQGLQSIFQFIQNQAGGFFSTLGLFVFLVGLIPFVWMTAVLITSILAMPVIVRRVHSESYASLEKRGHLNSNWWFKYVRLTLLFFVLWFLSLPLMLVPILGFLGPLLVTAYFHYRICLMDALSDYATEEEIHQIRTRYKSTAFSMGFVSAIFLSIPFWNWLSPILSAVLFTRFGFEALSEIRSQKS